jgi:hypothetical protein
MDTRDLPYHFESSTFKHLAQARLRLCQAAKLALYIQGEPEAASGEARDVAQAVFCRSIGRSRVADGALNGRDGHTDREICT